MAIENVISTAIVRSFSEKLLSGLDLDVAIVGGGPSAMVAARDLATAGVKVAVFERKLAPGGGTWVRRLKAARKSALRLQSLSRKRHMRWATTQILQPAVYALTVLMTLALFLKIKQVRENSNHNFW